jgi:hypothetical protein
VLGEVGLAPVEYCHTSSALFVLENTMVWAKAEMTMPSFIHSNTTVEVCRGLWHFCYRIS